MRKNKLLLLTALLLSGISTLSAQDRVAEIMTQTANKIKIAQRDYRVVEKTIADILYLNDTTGDNRFYSYYFSNAKRYHLNVFASNEDISAIAVAIYLWDADNRKWVLVTRNGTTGTDVTLNFDPKDSKTYYVLVTGDLRQNVNNTFFNLLIERD